MPGARSRWGHGAHRTGRHRRAGARSDRRSGGRTGATVGDAATPRKSASVICLRPDGTIRSPTGSTDRTGDSDRAPNRPKLVRFRGARPALGPASAIHWQRTTYTSRSAAQRAGTVGGRRSGAVIGRAAPAGRPAPRRAPIADVASTPHIVCHNCKARSQRRSTRPARQVGRPAGGGADDARGAGSHGEPAPSRPLQPRPATGRAPGAAAGSPGCRAGRRGRARCSRPRSPGR